jgi:hypothetical protein
MTKRHSGGAAFWLCFAASAAVGVAVEIGVSEMAHQREAWDSSSYWSIGLPAMIAGALLCGFFARRMPILIGYAPFLGQWLTMMARSSGTGPLAMVGVLLTGIMGLSGVAAAFVGVVAGKRVLGSAPTTGMR